MPLAEALYQVLKEDYMNEKSQAGLYSPVCLKSVGEYFTRVGG